MTSRKQGSPRDAAAESPRFLPLLILLFIGSGCAALIYEIVWYQELSLIVGSSAISLGAVLGTFMGGMCLGSLLLPRFVKPDEHPLKVYAKLEAGIGISGLLILVILPHAGGLYTSIGGPGISGLLVRGLFCALFLAVPTILMGATLPAVARWVETTPTGVSWLGFFYGGNIANPRSFSLSNQQSPGTYAFNGQVTGLGMADFFTGNLATFSQAGPLTLV